MCTSSDRAEPQPVNPDHGIPTAAKYLECTRIHISDWSGIYLWHIAHNTYNIHPYIPIIVYVVCVIYKYMINISIVCHPLDRVGLEVSRKQHLDAMRWDELQTAAPPMLLVCAPPTYNWNKQMHRLTNGIWLNMRALRRWCDVCREVVVCLCVNVYRLNCIVNWYVCDGSHVATKHVCPDAWHHAISGIYMNEVSALMQSSTAV